MDGVATALGNSDLASGASPLGRVALVIHNHQPVGNFDHVIRQALEDSYRPFLRTLTEFPAVRVVTHHSGCLLDWLVENASDYIDELSEAVERGQIELLGGPMDEPILASIPRRDRIGQIRMHHQRIKEVFQVDVAGMWVPERVWEHTFTGDLAAAGVQYTVLDDGHFRGAGLTDDQLTGSYVCEDEGRVIRVYPIYERLRYIIPFHPVDEVMAEIHDWTHKHPGGLAVFADDGEKFGVWPGTQKSVFEEGWLRSFFDQLTRAAGWLQTTTLADASREAPIGRISLPDTSYREMTEWVLPTRLQKQLVAERNRRPEGDPQWEKLKDFVRGGTWRNFLTKYPEAADMAARMKEVSARIELARQTHRDSDEELARATRLLYRGQCNCPYWHGAFGGLYLAHLRQATYRNLIAADTIVAKLDHSTAGKSWVDVETHDFNFDVRPEVKLSSGRLAAYLAPASGGQLYELDVRDCGTNLLATLARRPEPYHSAVGDSHDIDFSDEQSGSLQYDDRPRRALVDRFIEPGLSLEQFRSTAGVVQSFASTPFRACVHKRADRVECELTSISDPAARLEESTTVQVSKTVTLSAGHPGDVVIAYVLEGLEHGQRYHFCVELNVAGIAPNAEDRYLYSETGEKLGPVNAETAIEHCMRIGAADEWLGLDLSLEWNKPAGLWAFPIETVSGSEAGIEKTYQCTCFVPHWEFTAEASGRFEFELKVSCHTAMAQARKLVMASAAH